MLNLFGCASDCECDTWKTAALNFQKMYNEEIGRKLQKIDELDCALLEKSRKCNSLREDNNRLISNIEDKYEEIVSLKEQLNDSRENGCCYEEELLNTIEDLQDDLSLYKKKYAEEKDKNRILNHSYDRSKQEIAAKDEYIQKKFHVGYEVKIRDLEKIADDLQAQLNCANGLTEYHSNQEKKLKKELEKSSEEHKYYLNKYLNRLDETIQWKKCKGADRPTGLTVVYDGRYRVMMIRPSDKINELLIPMDEHKYYIALPPLPKD